MTLSIEQLRDLLEYDGKTGVFTWKRGPFRGKRAGTVSNGYLRVIAGGRAVRQKIYLHRLAWAFVHGEWPEDEIDHINGERTDNRLENLRACSRLLNARNMPIPSDNTTGVVGVCPFRGRFQAYLTVDRQKRCLGTYDTVEEAAAVRKEAERVHFGEFARR